LKIFFKSENDGDTVALPWKQEHSPLRDNYRNAKGRLNGTLKILHAQPELLKSYDNILKEQGENDFVEEIQLTTHGPSSLKLAMVM